MASKWWVIIFFYIIYILYPGTLKTYWLLIYIAVYIYIYMIYKCGTKSRAQQWCFLGNNPALSCGAYIAVWCINWTVAERAVQRCKPPRNETSLPAWAATVRQGVAPQSNPIQPLVLFRGIYDEPRLYQGRANFLFAPLYREKFIKTNLLSLPAIFST